MALDEIRGPDLAGVVADANEAGLDHVVIGGEIAGAHHLRVDSRHGVIDVMRGGLPPLDYDTAAARAINGLWRDTPFRVASLRTLVGFKRLAGRPGDRVDLEKLECANGELPIDPIPGLDDQA